MVFMRFIMTLKLFTLIGIDWEHLNQMYVASFSISIIYVILILFLNTWFSIAINLESLE